MIPVPHRPQSAIEIKYTPRKAMDIFIRPKQQ